METLQETLNGLALKLTVLGGIILFLVGITVVILRFIPLFSEIKRYIIGLSTLLGMYIWAQIYFY
ncbi:hypothetical protein [Salinibacillus xinjiangensis]|uniref:Uncharacterized protein n=1 Tax=Salinibacillus xinjiangensis TaxID=1229268 RepID=A0A6G1X7S8_9BACI|nr:hypothetical protein [Salinibacillus xinjiangensis]MRG86992.1 hypothetical protein [Salinibacillus xinjiangensis]